MKNKEKQNSEGIDGVAVDSSRSMALTIDWDLYARYLEDSDLSEDQKREFLETLWSIVVGFVDLGFDIHPVQQVAPDICGSNRKIPIPDSTDMVESSKQLSQSAFLQAAGHEYDDHGERKES